jgi:ubiquinone/menaquinone biosynthesis C-methylase UbiE
MAEAKYALAENATRPYAQSLIKKAAAAKFPEFQVLDLAAGTGAVVAALYEHVPKDKWDIVHVTAGDSNEQQLEYLKSRAAKNGWTGLKTSVVGGGRNDIQMHADTFTHLFINFGIFQFGQAALPKYHEVLKSGGFLGVTTWATLPWYPYVKKAIEGLGKSDAPSEKEVEDILYKGQAWGDASFVQKALSDAGFSSVEVGVEEQTVSAGTPEQFVDAMENPIKLLAGGRGFKGSDADKEKIVGALKGELLKVAQAEFGGEVKLQFKGLVATARK